MKTLAAICCAALLAAPASEPPAEHGPIFAGMPPERFMRETGGQFLSWLHKKTGDWAR